MKLEPFHPSQSRIVGQWLLTLTQARYPAHAGVFVYNDGTTRFYDIFSHRFIHDSGHPIQWQDQFWLREVFDEICVGEDAELFCRYTRRIEIGKQVTSWILRANREHRYQIDDGQDILPVSLMINNHLEVQYWSEIAKFCVYQPLKRENPREPLLPFPDSPSDPSDAQLNVPVDMPKPWWK